VVAVLELRCCPKTSCSGRGPRWPDGAALAAELGVRRTSAVAGPGLLGLRVILAAMTVRGAGNVAFFLAACAFAAYAWVR
jgi:hypothetical protein